MSADLKIRVVSELTTVESFTIYQQDIHLNVKNFQMRPLEKQYIAPKATFYTILPANIQVQGISNQDTGIYKTQVIDVTDYNTSYEVYEKDQALDIRPLDMAPTEGTVNIYNKCGVTREAAILKNSKLIFLASILPNDKLNFELKDAIYVSMCDYETVEESIRGTNLLPVEYIDFLGKDYLTIYLKEECCTGKMYIEYDFNSFEYPTI